jgi:putative ABC transport system permease protein
MARSQPVASLVTVAIVAAVCCVTLATTGQSAAAEARVLRGIDAAGTRLIVVEDDTGQGGISVASIAQIAAVSGVSWVVGFTAVLDVRNSALEGVATPVPMRAYYGRLPAQVVVRGRAPNAGEALVGAQASDRLGLTQGVGAVDAPNQQYAVVGSFSAADPLTFLDRSVLAPGQEVRVFSEQDRLRSIYLMVTDVAQVEPVTQALRQVIVSRTSEYSVATPAQLVALRAVVSDELGTSSRRLMVAVLAVGLLIVAVTLFGAVSARRRDFGRRRALGASRSFIATLVLVQTAITASIGALLGTVLGVAAVWRLAGSLPSASFVIGVGVLALLASLLAAAAPASVAALRDPVRILRVP